MTLTTDPRMTLLRRWLFWFVPIVALCLIIWFAHFSRWREFGFYEDDYSFFAPPLVWDRVDLLARLDYFRTLPQGRPLTFFGLPLIGYIANWLGDWQYAYLMGFGVVATNVILTFWLFYRLGASPIAAFLGALFAGLYPADPTHTLLTHAFALQGAMTFALVSAHLYLSENRWLRGLSYLPALAVLLTYEYPFMFLFALPLLRRRPNRGEAIRHAIILAALLAVMFVLRSGVGDSRMGLLNDPLDTLGKFIRAVLVGPIVSAGVVVRTPLTVLDAFHGGLLLPMAFLLVVGLVMVWLLRGSGKNFPSRAGLAAALLMIVLPYGLALIHPVDTTVGRMTSVHFASALGWGLLIAIIAHQKVLQYAVVVYLAVIMGYRVLIQEDFARSWQYQREFWSQVFELAPDLESGTLLLANGDLPETHYILTHSWIDPILLNLFYRIPAEWESPRLYPTIDNEDELWTGDPDSFTIYWGDPFIYSFSSGNVIVLEYDGERLVRSDAEFYDSPVGRLALKPLTDSTRTLEFSEIASIIEPQER